MPRHGDRKWWGLYLLVLLMAGLLYVDARIDASLKVHEVLGIAIIAMVFGLTFYWTEKHADLMETEGVDAQVPEIPSPAIGVLISGPANPAIPVGGHLQHADHPAPDPMDAARGSLSANEGISTPM